MIVKINLDGHELEFSKEYVENFERTVCDSFEETARVYLVNYFREKNIDDVDFFFFHVF